MRSIGTISNEREARTFSDYLIVRGIKNEIEREDSGWNVWVHHEDEIDPARELLREFRMNPDGSEYRRAAGEARKIVEAEEAKNRAAAKRTHDVRTMLVAGYGTGRLTKVLIGICVALFVAIILDPGNRIERYLLISEYFYDRTLPEVRHGQVWRLFTPVLMHSDRLILHILFNMLWLRSLGSMIEYRESSRKLLLLVLGTGIFSNLVQYWTSGPFFVGMSGVVYGLLGYIWMKSKHDPLSGYFLHPNTVAFMMIWLLIGFTGLLSVANGAHAGGLAAGAAWGFFSAQRSR